MRNKMLIATQNGLRIFKRVNEFWEEHDHALTGMNITAVGIAGDHGLVGTTEGVYVTRDSGESWKLESDGITTPHVRWVSVHPQDPRYFYVGTEPANIYTRLADDEKWRRSEEVARLRDQNDWYMPYLPNPGCVRGFAFYDNRIYAAVEVGGLLVSEDYGDTWELAAGSTGKPRQAPKEGQIDPEVHSVATHAASKDLVLAPTGGGFYISEDGGAHWSLKYDCYVRAVWLDPVNATHMLLGPADGVGKGGRIEHSTDGGETWHLVMDQIEDKWPNAMVERFFAAENEIYAILSNGKILVARIGEFAWQYLLPDISNVNMLTLV